MCIPVTLFIDVQSPYSSEDILCMMGCQRPLGFVVFVAREYVRMLVFLVRVQCRGSRFSVLGSRDVLLLSFSYPLSLSSLRFIFLFSSPFFSFSSSPFPIVRFIHLLFLFRRWTAEKCEERWIKTRLQKHAETCKDMQTKCMSELK